MNVANILNFDLQKFKISTQKEYNIENRKIEIALNHLL